MTATSRLLPKSLPHKQINKNSAIQNSQSAKTRTMGEISDDRHPNASYKVSNHLGHREEQKTNGKADEKEDEFDIDIYADVKSPAREESLPKSDVKEGQANTEFMHPDRMRLLGLIPDEESTTSRDRNNDSHTDERPPRGSEVAQSEIRDSIYSPRIPVSRESRRDERNRTHHRRDTHQRSYPDHHATHGYRGTHLDGRDSQRIQESIDNIVRRNGYRADDRYQRQSNPRFPTPGSMPVLSEDARRLKEELRRGSSASRAQPATHSPARTRQPRNDLFRGQSENCLPPRPPGLLPPRQTDQHYVNDNSDRSRDWGQYRRDHFKAENRGSSSYRSRSRERRDNKYNLHSSGNHTANRSQGRRDEESSPYERRGPSHRDREPEMRSNNYRPRDHRSRSPSRDRRRDSPRDNQRPTLSIKGSSERRRGLSNAAGGIQFKGAASRNRHSPRANSVTQPRGRTEQYPRTLRQ